MLTRSKRQRQPAHGTWKLQDAKARFSEIVRKAKSDGPQRVTVHGKDAVVIVAASDYDRAARKKGKPLTGAEFVAAMRKGYRLGLRLAPPLGERLPVSPPLQFPENER